MLILEKIEKTEKIEKLKLIEKIIAVVETVSRQISAFFTLLSLVLPAEGSY